MTDAPAIPTKDTLRASAIAAEVTAYLAAIDAAKGNQSVAAQACGVAVSTLMRRLRGAGWTATKLRERWPLSGRQPRTKRKGSE